MLPGTTELDHDREQIAAYLEESPDRATITRRTRVADSSGGYRETTATVYTDAPILVYQKRGGGGEEYTTDAGRLTHTVAWEALLPTRYSVNRADRITLDSGRAFEIVESNDGETFDLARILTLVAR
jgi:hypothetical protein